MKLEGTMKSIQDVLTVELRTVLVLAVPKRKGIFLKDIILMMGILLREG